MRDMGQPPQKKYRVVVIDHSGRREVIVQDSDLESAMRLKLSLVQRFPEVIIEEQPEGESSFMPDDDRTIQQLPAESKRPSDRGQELSNDSQNRVVRFVVYDEPIWMFDDLVTLATDPPDLISAGDTRIEPCDEGLAVYLVVEPFRDIRIANDAFGQEWRTVAIRALKAHFSYQTPNGVLRLFRDPLNGSLRNIME